MASKIQKKGGECVQIKGVLQLKHDDSYIMFYKGRLINLTEFLNCMLLDDVYVKVQDKYSKKILFEEQGKLIKEKVQPCYYLHHVNRQDLDSILWNNVGRELIIEIRNISKY